ncbi:MAG: GNAT family N-acetyltransferase, partial [Rhodobacterales bacterium]
MWDRAAGAGQSGLEIGREKIRTDVGQTFHYTHWVVAERDGQLLGGMNSCRIARVSGTSAQAELPEFLVPLNALKAVAVGTWYIATAAVLPEARGQGVGSALLAKAEELARDAGCRQLTLMVGSFNAGAHRLYLRCGFREWDRRGFVPFDRSDQSGEWILMVRDLP